MKKLTATAVAFATLFGAGATLADPMRFDVGTNSFDAARLPPNGFDLNSITATFTTIGFNDLLATSVYELAGGALTGNFYDTNRPADLAALGLISPDCLTNTPLGACDIDSLGGLVPPLGSDNEGFLQKWDLQVVYRLEGVLTPGGPTYTGGTFSVYFNDFSVAGQLDEKVIEGTLTGSNIQIANLDLFFDITFAKPGFFFIDSGSGYIDAATLVGTANPATLRLDTNVDPPVPTLGDLTVVNATTAYRQAELDGTIRGVVPEPGTLALVGLSLVGFGAIRRSSAKE